MFKFIVNKLKKVSSNCHLFTSNNVNIHLIQSDFLLGFILSINILFQIYPDPESEKAIMGSVVYCIHHKEGCQWSDELRKLKVCGEL